MNRRQRRAQAASSPKTLKSADDIPLAQPERNKGAGAAKTLYEVAAEKQHALMPETKQFTTSPQDSNIVRVKIGSKGEVIEESGPNNADGLTDAEAVPPLLDTLFFALSLSALHFTLEVLTVHQYAQELLFRPIFKDTIFVAFPTLFLLIHLFRGHLIPASLAAVSQDTIRRVVVFRQLLFVVIANYAGCYLIYLTNDKGYYAVMKNAPGVGTVWVWAVLELGLVGALAGVVGPGCYAWYWGYGIT